MDQIAPPLFERSNFPAIGTVVGTPGYSMPDLIKARRVSFEAIARGEIATIKLVSTQVGSNNWVVLADGSAPTQEIRLHTLGLTTGATVVLGRDVSLSGDIRLMGIDQTIIFVGGHAEVGHSGKINAQVFSRRGLLFIGSRSTSNGTTFVLSGDDCGIVVGDDCMFAAGVHIVTHDQHAVMDIVSRQRVNVPASILIEPHVWLGRNSTVGKKVCIGLGSVVGANALVTKGCPRFSVLAGSPAKVIRSGSTWDRVATGRASTVDRVIELADQVAEPGTTFWS